MSEYSIQKVFPEKIFRHIYDNIFKNLPTEDLLNAGLTCKIWKSLTDKAYEKQGKQLPIQ